MLLGTNRAAASGIEWSATSAISNIDPLVLEFKYFVNWPLVSLSFQLIAEVYAS